jgi:hypothetical protein
MLLTRDVVLIFDRSWNGYRVQEYPHHYFHVNHYYRWHGDRWQKARCFRGPWVSVHHRRMANERRDDHRETARERREVVKAKREVRREIAESERPRRTAKLTGDLARGSARHRRPTVPKAADEELLANRGVD